MQFKGGQWLVEISFGIGILLVSSTALMLAMQHNTDIPELNRSSGNWLDHYFKPAQIARQVLIRFGESP